MAVTLITKQRLLHTEKNERITRSSQSYKLPNKEYDKIGNEIKLR